MKVNLNTADWSELMAVGFGRAAANSVIAQRSRQPYTEVKELLRTWRVGEVTYQRVKDSVFVDEPEQINAEGEMAIMDEQLRSALDGVELTEREERYLEWLSRMDSETVEVFAGLFEKAKSLGKIKDPIG